MSDGRLGAAFRAVRIRAGRRQADVAVAAGVSASTVSRIERGRASDVSIDGIRSVGSALDIRVDLVARWRGGELDRIVNARHSALHEAFAAHIAGRSGWVAVPEASFSIYGERGLIDVLAWHELCRMVLVIELKTELVDVQELIGSVDRKRRLALQIGRERGWSPTAASSWVVMAEGRTNRRHVAAHRTVLRSAFPGDGHDLRSWLARPADPISGLSFLPYEQPWNVRRGLSTPHRVRVPRRR